MISRLLSSDYPRSRILTVILIAILIGLTLAPFIFPGARALNVAAKVCVFIVLVASFDLLLGYTGIFSFAHTMFFGIGAYGVAVASTRIGAGWDALTIGIGGALALSLILSLVIGLVSLRVRALFYAMITLAVAAAFQTLASQLSEITGGDDGLNFKLPDMFSPGNPLFDQPVFGVTITGQILTYYVVFIAAVLLFLAMLRVVNSPFGRVLQAIRENDFRAEAIGYRIVVFRVWSNIIGALFATLAGCLYAIWLHYNGPDTTLAGAVMTDILLIVVIGGMGTMYGAVCGTTIFLLAESYLQDLFKIASDATASVPMLSAVLSPDRWLLWLGVLYVLSVYFLPMGIVGKLRIHAVRSRK